MFLILYSGRGLSRFELQKNEPKKLKRLSRAQNRRARRGVRVKWWPEKIPVLRAYFGNLSPRGQSGRWWAAGRASGVRPLAFGLWVQGRPQL